MTAKQSVYERITDAMIASLEAGTIPWKQTWQGTGLGAFPANLTSGKAYRGVNLWVLAMSGRGPSRYWLTYKQAKKAGGQVRRGERGTGIVFWSFPTPEQKKEGRKPFARAYTVFHVSQVDGLEDVDALKAETLAREASTDTDKGFDASAQADGVVASYLKHGPSLSHDGMSACYIPSTDRVSMPQAERFESSNAYYSVLFHELTHSTGHHSRLARDGVVNPIRFCSHDYSGEELVAEMGASYLRELTGVEDTATHDNSDGYIAGWLKTLKGDARVVMAAAGQAQKAVDLITGESLESDKD